ncbi:glycosyltransferase family 4 protein [Alphaproteobacteria bacterium]|nr:glycosyltransferase family 4 protein [Alphaproteobacteria bacterium]
MILLISYYYPPELSAGAFRSIGLSRSILNYYKNNYDKLTILTAKEYRHYQNINYEELNNINSKIKIIRIKVPFKGGGLLKGLVNYFCFFIFGFIKVLPLKPTYIFSTSGRLGTNFLAFTIASYKRSKLILDVRDVFSINLKRLILKKQKYISGILFTFFISIEKYIYTRASHVNVVSPYFIKIYSKLGFQTKNWSINTNGIDSQFFKNRKLEFSKQNINKSKTILYAGNLGDGQKLDVFLKDFSNNLPVGWKFLIVGNGSRKKYIVNLINKYKLDNVTLKKPVTRIELDDLYKQSSVLLVSLGQELCLSYVIPSKIFEYGTFNKPILAGVKGFTSNFIKKELPLVEVFRPGNGLDAINGLNHLIKLELDKKTINELNIKKINFMSKFNRKKLSDKFIDYVLKE